MEKEKEYAINSDGQTAEEMLQFVTFLVAEETYGVEHFFDTERIVE